MLQAKVSSDDSETWFCALALKGTSMHFVPTRVPCSLRSLLLGCCRGSHLEAIEQCSIIPRVFDFTLQFIRCVMLFRGQVICWWGIRGFLQIAAVHASFGKGHPIT